MEKTILLITALLFMSGCICCNTDVLNNLGNSTVSTTLEAAPETTQTTIVEQTTETTLAESETTLTTSTTTGTTESTETTGTTITTNQNDLASCLKKKGIDSDEVVFLYTTTCCSTLDRTVNQLGSYKFRKYEVGISITADERYVLECLGLQMADMKTMTSAQFWCPASDERLEIPPEEFIGAKDVIRNFAIACRQKALENE